VIAVDQVTKSWAEERLARGPIHLIGPIAFRLQYNSGVAFSLGAGHGAIVTAVVSVAVVGLFLAALAVRRPVFALAVGLVVGGAASNLCDRLFRDHGGAVTDWIYTRYWPTFNLADASIVIGSVLIVVLLVRRETAVPPGPEGSGPGVRPETAVDDRLPGRSDDRRVVAGADAGLEEEAAGRPAADAPGSRPERPG
jgi:signal peptidase II